MYRTQNNLLTLHKETSINPVATKLKKLDIARSAKVLDKLLVRVTEVSRITTVRQINEEI